MNVGSRFAKQLGFSLVETLIALGVVSIVAVGTSMQLLKIYNTQLSTQSKANAVQTQGLIHKMFGKTSVNNTWTCAQTIVPTNSAGTFNTSGKTDVKVIPRASATASEIFQAGSVVPGSAQFVVNQLYLDDVTAVSAGTTYLADLYMVADTGIGGTSVLAKPRNLGTFVIQVDAANKIVGCNFDTGTTNAQEQCESVDGMNWDATTSTCTFAMDSRPDNLNTSCPGAFVLRNSDNLCVPQASGCGPGQLASGFNNNIMYPCATPTMNPAVGQPTQALLPTQLNTPNVVPIVISPVPTYSAITTAQPPIPSSITAPTSVNPACQATDVSGNTNAMAFNEYTACSGDPTCSSALSASTVSVSNCTVKGGSSYQAPAAATPSPAPPPDNTCQCGSGRIANGDYCSYCTRNVNYGFGLVDYAYSSAVCTNGALIPDNTKLVDTSNCTGRYAPTVFFGSKLRQLSGFDSDIP